MKIENLVVLLFQFAKIVWITDVAMIFAEFL